MIYKVFLNGSFFKEVKTKEEVWNIIGDTWSIYEVLDENDNTVSEFVPY